MRYPIRQMLSNAKFAMTEHAPSCCRDIGDRFVHCPNNSDVIGGFEF